MGRMEIVAVAGGTGNVGRTIVEAILATGKHEVKILSRKPNPTLESELGVPIIVVDYAKVENLTKVLEDNNIHTVISALTTMPSPNGEHPKEIELIRAADASNVTKRMISTDWGIPHTKEHIPRLVTVGPKLQVQEELKKTTDLETTRFLNGYFLDYWGIPAVKSHMPPITLVVDMPNDIAAVPGSGNTPVVFTHTTDVAKYVAASLSLDKWDPESYVIGDRVTWNEFVHLAEEAKGTKFKVTYDSTEKLGSGQSTELPGQAAAYNFLPREVVQSFASTFGLWFEEGAFNLKPTKTLNDQFPEITTIKVKDILTKAWKRS
ncbi:nmrA-like family protein [Bisporella sp. PMI_857]|nr:nmrA-like family protein [Bisporella sp. PMI_857]